MTILTDKLVADTINRSKAEFLKRNPSGVFTDALRDMKITHKINTRLKTVGGKAIFKKPHGYYEVQVNPKVQANGTLADFENTVTHELAHCVQHKVRGYSDHGSEWKDIHGMFGGNGARCHQISMKSVAGRDWLYVNLQLGKAWWITAKRAKRAVRSKDCLILHKSDPCTSQYAAV